METKQIITDIQALWNDIENWYENNAPKRLQDLMDGASQEEIRCFETTIGFSLPNDYLASLSIHNGYVDINSYSYISIDESLRKWLMMKGLSEEGAFKDFEPHHPHRNKIQNTWWCLGWIPFAEDGSGNMICIDITPDINGVVGQIIYMEIQGEGPIASQFRSFFEWLESYRNDLYEGRYEVGEEDFLHLR